MDVGGVRQHSVRRPTTAGEARTRRPNPAAASPSALSPPSPALAAALVGVIDLFYRRECAITLRTTNNLRSTVADNARATPPTDRETHRTHAEKRVAIFTAYTTRPFCVKAEQACR
jgi:hypothetical protein